MADRSQAAAPGSTGPLPEDRPPPALALLAAALGAASCGITVADCRQPEQPLVYVNDRFLEITGYAASELLGRNCRLLQGAGTDPAVVRQIREDLAAGRDGSYRLLNYRKSGESFWNELRLVHAADPAGGLCHVIGIQSDVSQEILQEEKSQRFETLGMLAAGVAHEINTPAQYISDNLHFIEDSLSDLFRLAAQAGSPPEGGGMEAGALAYMQEELPLAIAQCKQGIVQIGGIVSAVRAFAYSSEGQSRSVNVIELVAQAMTMTRSQWKYVAKAEAVADGEAAMVECAPSEILQVIVNLIINATHAIEDAGRPGRGSIVIGARALPDCVALTVTDNGIGIPAGQLARVFDPHFTSKSQGRGTGLGLSICRKIVEDRHGGTIGVASREGEGTSVTVTLPVRTDPAKPVAARTFAG